MPDPQVQVVSMRVVGRQLSSKASRTPTQAKSESGAFESTVVAVLRDQECAASSHRRCKDTYSYEILNCRRQNF